MMRKSLQGSLLEASQKTDTNKRKSLQDIKSLLEDRGGIIKSRYDMNKEADECFVRDVYDKDKVTNVNNLYDLDNKVSFGDTTLSDNSNNIVKCNSRHTRGRWCFSRFKTMMLMLIVIVFVDTRLQTEARSTEPRYETAYACEGKTLKIGCSEGSVIHLIRANYGRFSITICNDHGNTDWSVNCMSTKSLRVLHSRCSMQQNCSILASTNMFGDPCPNTLKYLEAHYQCVPASTTSTTNRPSPPWLITSQPTVWRSTAPPLPKNPVQPPTGERKKPTVITPPTFRPHITLPPEVKIGDVGSKKTTTKLPETPPEMLPPPPVVEPKATVEVEKVIEPENRPRNDKPSRDREENVTEETPQLSSKDDSYDPTPPVQLPPPKENAPDTDIVNDLFPSVVPNVIRRMYCPHVTARGLNWNWTLAGTYAVQPCPGGATGLARWKCVVTLRKSTEEDRPKRRGPSLQSGENFRDLGLSLQSGENFRDLGLNEPTLNKQMQRLESLGNDALLKGRDELEHRFDYRASLNLPQNMDFDKIDFEWHGATPDLSGCRSVWLNSLEARVREGESLLSISNDLAQVTSSKTLYGGDLMTTTSIMKKLAENMKAQMRKTAQTFPDPTQREAVITDMLLGIIKTGSNLLDESQHSSWADLNQESQNLAASALLTHLEENAFLLADAVAKEKKILQIVKNICLSVRVLEVKNVKDETFPSPIAQEQWKASEDLITIPKAALLDNRQDDLVRIVFFAFDRLEQILPPVFGKAPLITFEVWDDVNSDKPEKEKRKVERVLNSKVISASLGNGRHIQLSQKVQLTLKHLSIDNVTNPMCVFWDYTMHGWSTEGCVVEWTNLTHTGCGCWHLTNFAILMDVHEVKLDRAHDMALGLLTVIGCAISSVALFAAIIVFQCFRNMKSDRVFIHKNLCCCLLMAEVIFMVGINQTENRVFCGVIAGLLHYFFLAAFAWMFLEGFHLYAMLVEVFEPERPRVRWYCAGAYLAPAFVVLVSAGVHPAGYGTARNCWLSTDHLFVMSFVGPVAVVLVANWICLGMVIYMMCRHSTVAIKAKENSKLYKLRVWLNSSLVLAFLLGLTWTFGLLYLNEQTVVMAYIFTILNSLQGLIIFIFHCLLNEVFQKECANLARRYTWLSCCQFFAGQPSQPIPNNAPTASSSNHVENRQGSVKSRRYHQSGAVDSEDVVDPRDVTNTASKHHPGGTATLPHHDTLSRQMAQQNHLHAQYGDCDVPPVSPRHAIKDEESPLHHPHPQGYNTTRSYNHDFRNPHVYMSQHSPGSQEMIFRKHYKDENRRKHHHHHGSQNMNHTYSEIASQQGRIYRRGSEQEFRVIQDDPVYEEIERNETLMSDVSDDNSGPENGRHNLGHHGSSGSKFYGDHRPLISYSPGERHQHDQEHYGKYGKWDALERAYDPRVCESGRLMHPYHQPQESNMRAFAAVLNGENNVVCHLEPHNSYDVYQPQAGNPRTVSQPSF